MRRHAEDLVMFDRPRGSLPLLVLLFLIPQSLFVIGDYMAVGIRFPLFRFQAVYQSVNTTAGVETTLVPSMFTIVRELQFVLMGVVGSAVGRTAIATYLWLAGVIILIAAAVLVISWQVLDNMGHARYPGPLIIVTGVIFLVWALVQFGPLFYGPLGYSIPVGVPFLWYSGYQFMQAAKKAEE